ncbi:MAG: sporulation protein [Alicyclobacillaceae bacterium]|nr:sporulation protein [Alicyclobacillaceae bacterium]
MFRKFLSKLGIGGASIDLILETGAVRMGETVRGQLAVAGGETEQSIEGIQVNLVVTSQYKAGDAVRHVKEVVARQAIGDAFVIQPRETKTYPFEFAVPAGIPVSSVTTRYYFATNLEIDAAFDAKDRDPVTVLPSGLLQNFLEGFALLGFVPKREAYNGRHQMIDFSPTSWLSGQLDELVFQFDPRKTRSGVEGFFEIDKKNKGLFGMIADELDLDEKKGGFRFTASELASKEKAAETIRSFIERHFRNLV